MEQSEYIAALDLGSSKIIAMAGKKNDQGILSVLASEKVESGAYIRRGCVHNVEETAKNIRVLIYKLNNKINPKIEKIYVGIGGQSLRTETFSVSRIVNGALVDNELIDSLLEECKTYEPEFAEVLDIVSPEYFLDGQPEANPKGIPCTKIEVHFKLILGRPSLKRTLQLAIAEKANIQIAGYFISPIATAEAVLNESEKEMGCALIEFGAGVTYLSIYKKGLLKYLVAIPLGGKVITNDICDLQVSEEEAESLKINFGSALIEFDKNVKVQTAKLAEGLHNSRQIELNTLNNIIEARVDEILANIIAQIEISEYASALNGGIIITGGGAALKNIAESIKNKTGQEVRLASVKKSLSNQVNDWSQDIANPQIIGLLSLGKENCAKKVALVEKSTPQQIAFFTDNEVKVVKPAPPKTPEIEKKKGLLGGLSRKIDGFSKRLFEDD